jgi:hypothetical protein
MKNKISMVSHSAKYTHMWRKNNERLYFNERLSVYSMRRLRELIAKAADKDRIYMAPYLFSCGWIATEKKK